MALRALGIVSVLGLLPVFAACEQDSTTGGGPVLGTPDVPSSSGSPPVEPPCSASTAGPTHHEGDIVGEEVWKADASPHILDGTVTVRNGAKLTIEPCAEVRLAKSAYIQIAMPGTPNTGSLVAEGTATRPIRFLGDGEARWSSVTVQAPGTARFAYVTFENGGGGDFQEGATVVALGDAEDGADPILFVDHVTITKSLGAGAWIQRGATFLPGSRDLTIRESGNDTTPYPLEIEEHSLDALPTGSYTGNERDEILVEPRGGRTAGSGLLADATIHDRGVPYHVGRSKGQNLNIGGRPDGKLVTLTIEPGVVMRFEAGAGLNVQRATNQLPSNAALRAIGTAERPIVLGSAAATPHAGDWRGIAFGGIPDASNRIEHVRIEDAGYDCGCILNTCSAITQHEGAIIFTAQPPSAFITNTKFVDIAGHGVSEGFDGTFVDFRPTNEFVGLTGCAQTRPRDTSMICPTPRPACD
jgi:hypothetical protein